MVKGTAFAAILAAVGIVAGRAAGDTGLPTLPTPTLPSISVPTPTVPQVPAPAPPATVPKPSLPSAPVSAPAVVAHSGAGAGSSGTGGGASAGGSSGSYSGVSGAPGGAAVPRPHGPRVTRLRSSHRYVSLRGRHTTTIVFSCPSSGSVVLVFQQVAPICRLAGRLRVRAHSGVNRITIGTKVGRRRLGPGTYRITPRRAARRVRLGITLVVVETASPSAAELASARAANACVPAAAGGAAYSPPPGYSMAAAGGAKSGTPGSSGAAGGAKGGAPFKPHSQNPSKDASAGSGSSGSGTARAAGYTPSSGSNGAGIVRSLLLAGVALATLLLALAAMPEAVARTSRFGEVVAHRRLSFAVAGGATLAAFVLAYVVAGA